jgi:hypothetical protein
MTDRELMQQALDALDKLLDKLNADICDNSGIWDEYCDGGNAMQALRARLTQPEPEPVAWMHDSHVGFNVPLYTAPPQREWQGLTDEDYEAMAEKYVTNCYFDTLKYSRAIEAKLKEKNT